MVFLTDAQVHYAIATIIGFTLVKMGWRAIRLAWWEVSIVGISCIFYLLEHEGYKVLQNEIMTRKEELVTIQENLVTIRDQLVAREQSCMEVSSPKRKMAHPLMTLLVFRSIIASPSSTLQTP